MTTRNPSGYREADRIARTILSYFRKLGIEAAVRPDRYGVSITDLPDGTPVARLRLCTDDNVEVLWRNGVRWKAIGDFGGMRMPMHDALEFIAEDSSGIFWRNR